MVRQVLAEGARAAVWVHRAGTATDEATADLLRQLSEHGTPYLVVINHDGEANDDGGWARPLGLPSPRAVLSGNLVASGDVVASLQREVWKLFGV